LLKFVHKPKTNLKKIIDGNGFKRLDNLEGKTDLKSVLDRRICAVILDKDHDSSFEDDNDRGPIEMVPHAPDLSMTKESALPVLHTRNET
jgi:hypothetical protein